MMLILFRDVIQLAVCHYKTLSMEALLLIFNHSLIAKMSEIIEKIEAQTVFKGIWIEIMSQIFTFYIKSLKEFGENITTSYQFPK